MKLNADIIYSGLAEKYNVEMTGPKSNALSLSKPEFYMEQENVFLSDHLYLATVEHLPARARINPGSVLICIGEGFTLNYYREKLCLIIIKNRADFFSVFHAIQNIFERYTNWERQIYSDVFNGLDLRSILNDSRDIFGKDLYVLDKSFRIIASTGNTDDKWKMTDSGALDSHSLSTFLSESDLMLEKRNAIKLETSGIRTLCVNLFNKNDQYEGCLCVSQGNDEFEDGKDKLAETLAECLQMAVSRNPLIINDSQNSLKKVMQTLIEELPLSQSQRILLTSRNNKTNYCCIYMRYLKSNNQLPLSYVCDIFEDGFADSWAFIIDDAVVAFVDTASLISSDRPDYRITLNRRLTEFIGQTGLCCGISNEFSDLFNIRVHYLQASTAVENGQLFDSNGRLFYFSSYALTQMIINSMGGLPTEAYYPSGFKSLLEHDRLSPISYRETLKVFLEENMSFTSAAQKLFIHRSTLIDRISRIEKELGIDLKDNDSRLQLEILLKAMDIEEMLRNH